MLDPLLLKCKHILELKDKCNIFGINPLTTNILIKVQSCAPLICYNSSQLTFKMDCTTGLPKKTFPKHCVMFCCMCYGEDMQE